MPLQPEEAGGPTHVDGTSTILLKGFSLALLAAISWGVGNTLTKYSADKYTGQNGAAAVIDISLANYIGGVLTLSFVSIFMHLYLQRRGVSEELELVLQWRMAMPALFKGANTYAFVAAVTFVSAAAAATLENLNVLWTAVILSILSRKLLQWLWYVSALTVALGTGLVVGLSPSSLSGHRVGEGLALSVVAGLTFSAFTLTWRRVQTSRRYLPQQALETAILLTLAMTSMLIIHYSIGKVYLGGSWVPFSTARPEDLALQALNGTFNVGLTYFLMARALFVMEGAGPTASLLLGLGVSFSILATVVSGWFILSSSFQLTQFLGVFVFSAGFAAVQLASRREGVE